jgi:hypothetical protein
METKERKGNFFPRVSSGRRYLSLGPCSLITFFSYSIDSMPRAPGPILLFLVQAVRSLWTALLPPEMVFLNIMLNPGILISVDLE